MQLKLSRLVFSLYEIPSALPRIKDQCSLFMVLISRF
jgi:hypothetical protein